MHTPEGSACWAIVKLFLVHYTSCFRTYKLKFPSPNFTNLFVFLINKPKMQQDQDFMPHEDYIEPENLTFSKKGPYTIGIPSKSPKDLKTNILAGITAFLMDYKSMDYVRKRYEASWEIHKDTNFLLDLLDDVFANIKKLNSEAVNKMEKRGPKPDSMGLFAAEVALVRLQLTFRRVMLLIKTGCHFEASSLNRIILEQLAWVSAIYGMNDETIVSISPSKCIPNLKFIFPNAGQLYGRLSKESHIVPSEAWKYVRKNAEKIQIIISSNTFSPDDSYHLLILADWFQVMTEYIHSSYFSEDYTLLQKTESNSYMPSTTRKMVDLINQYQNDLKKIPKENFEEFGSPL